MEPSESQFAVWLAAKHPDVRLTSLQAGWVGLQETGLRNLVVWPKASGKTFVLELWREFVESDGR